MITEEPIERLRKLCWDRALTSYGTARIFEKRARRYKNLLRSLDFLGIIVPVFVGGIVLSFGTNLSLLPRILTIASILGMIQLVMSVLSLVMGWQDALVYSEGSVSTNYRLSREYEKLGTNPPNTFASFELQFSLLEKENQLQEETDNKQGVTEKEKREGMRAGLRQFQRQCAACGEIPQSMRPSDCDVCGNF